MPGTDALSRHLRLLVDLEANITTEPSHSSLVKEWEVAMKMLAYSPEDFAIRGDRPLFETYGDHPLLAFSALVRGGLYPPPELMLWLCAAYTEYLKGEGGTEIEEVLFGKVEQRRGGGKYAHRIYRDRDLAVIVGGLEDLISADPCALNLKCAVINILPGSSLKLIDSLLRRLRGLGVNQKNWIKILRPDLDVEAADVADVLTRYGSVT